MLWMTLSGLQNPSTTRQPSGKRVRLAALVNYDDAHVRHKVTPNSTAWGERMETDRVRTQGAEFTHGRQSTTNRHEGGV